MTSGFFSRASVALLTALVSTTLFANSWKTSTEISRIDESDNVFVTLQSDKATAAATHHLIVRCKEGDTEVLITTVDRPDVESEKRVGDAVTIRLDNQPPKKEVLSRSADGATFFFQHPVRLIKALIDHKSLHFQYNSGTTRIQTRFSVAGLYKVVTPVREACGWGAVTATSPGPDDKKAATPRFKQDKGIPPLKGSHTSVAQANAPSSRQSEVPLRKPYDIYLTDLARDGYPQRLPKPPQSFDCQARIYGVVVHYSLERGNHNLKVEWYGPKGELREVTRYPFKANGVSDTVWAWLHLKRPPSAILDRMLFGNRSSGMEEFIGDWVVKFSIDEKLIETREFKVIC